MEKHRLELRPELKLNLYLILRNEINLLLKPAFELENELELNTLLNPFLKLIKKEKPSKKFFVEKPIRENAFNISLSNEKENLIAQIEEELDGIEKDIAKEIIYSCDESGFLRESLEEIASFFGVDLDFVEDIRAFVMEELEPIGFGSKDMFEFFELQIRKFHKDSISYLNYLKDLKLGKRVLNKNFLDFLKTLKKSPSNSGLVGDLPKKVDVYVEKDKDELVPYFFEDEFVLETVEDIDVKDEYFRELYKKAKEKVAALNTRKELIKKVVNKTISVQKEFFILGKPLKTLHVKDVALELNLSPSTISRLINQKYLKFEGNIYKLRSFFVRESKNISKDELLELIKDITKLNSNLTDKEISELLKEKGINIAIRTVNKYRNIIKHAKI